MDRPDCISEHVNLAPMTSIRVGGKARYLARCTTDDEVMATLKWAAGMQLPLQILGGGSNILFDDRGFDGVILKMELLGITLDRDHGDVEVSARAGEDWDGFVQHCIETDLSGIECLSGIPGMVGATPMQNVGAYGQEVAATIVAVRAIDRHSLQQVVFDNDQCRFRYRNSRFKSEDRGCFVITDVVYRLCERVKPQVLYRQLSELLSARGGLEEAVPGKAASSVMRDAVLELRRRKSMVVDERDPNSRSVGSFFLNPVLSGQQLEDLKRRCTQLAQRSDSIPVFSDPSGHKVSAAWLVERAGFLKGQALGGAAISENHALALVNRGGGCRDLVRLAKVVQDRVLDLFEIRLEREPVVVNHDGTHHE